MNAIEVVCWSSHVNRKGCPYFDVHATKAEAIQDVYQYVFERWWKKWPRFDSNNRNGTPVPANQVAKELPERIKMKLIKRYFEDNEDWEYFEIDEHKLQFKKEDE